ncbi:MAG: L-threonylcarbamoyladenylate synthase [Gammaproteobacteria bacterium]|nr:L-threonylcarbamoyladenylate synthase [Gammaproteobacteria bacterium]
MSQFFQIHPDNPQQRLIAQAAAIIRSGGVIIYPTDSCYAIGCHLGDKNAVDRIRRIRQVNNQHDFTLVCRDLTEVGTYARLDNIAFRLIKNITPGPYTFILPATGEVPRRLLNPKRKTIGVRIPDNAIVKSLLDSLGEPIMSTTLSLPGEEYPMIDPYEMKDTLGHQVDLIIDGGFCGMEPTSVVSLLDGVPEVLREGKGDLSAIVD